MTGEAAAPVYTTDPLVPTSGAVTGVQMEALVPAETNGVVTSMQFSPASAATRAPLADGRPEAGLLDATPCSSPGLTPGRASPTPVATTLDRRSPLRATLLRGAKQPSARMAGTSPQPQSPARMPQSRQAASRSPGPGLALTGSARMPAQGLQSILSGEAALSLRPPVGTNQSPSRKAFHKQAAQPHTSQCLGQSPMLGMTSALSPQTSWQQPASVSQAFSPRALAARPQATSSAMTFPMEPEPCLLRPNVLMR
jgi:hypothetical protein